MASKEHIKLASTIRQKLREQGKSVEKLALELEMSPSYFYAFLNGRKGITLATLERVAKGMEIDLKDLFN